MAESNSTKTSNHAMGSKGCIKASLITCSMFFLSPNVVLFARGVWFYFNDQLLKQQTYNCINNAYVHVIGEHKTKVRSLIHIRYSSNETICMKTIRNKWFVCTLI